MQDEAAKQIEEMSKKLTDLKTELNFDTKKKELEKIKLDLTHPDFWQDREKAEKITHKLKNIQAEIKSFEDLDRKISDAKEAAADPEAASQIKDELQTIKSELKKLEEKTLFSGQFDAGEAILSISAGTGGTDAQDWAEKLLRMYLRFSQQKGWKTKIISISSGEEAGIKNATIEIAGDYAYGHLKVEQGVHRLVRKSPFNAQHLRQTSFALVEATPFVPEVTSIQIAEKDLKIETFRARGHGGQSVNTTDSAVRITHLPSRISVSCQNERSQLQNKQTALKILQSRLYQLEQEKRETSIEQERGIIQQAKWGAQIRSYVMDPYKLVKDHRTNYEEKDIQKVLDGEIESFIINALKNRKESNA